MRARLARARTRFCGNATWIRISYIHQPFSRKSPIRSLTNTCASVSAFPNQCNYADQVPAALWRVRYFRDSHPRSLRSFCGPDGSLHFRPPHSGGGNSGRIADERKESRARVEKFLAEEKKIDLQGLGRSLEPSSTRSPHRIDHSLDLAAE